ncbi:purine-cytosine permease family protein [Erwinia billingiae]|jgi:NCS1 family nucleobase:cation symporter-1|uniref:purine-cytosine permease family protein n=1 Tax=Erwinia billingiae TaxID=182337 RepID=UPI000CFFBC07|nr:cytosine permease [Erwinia billingiae]PRB60330.1 cytosine permease [Erwinia billingiae]
MSSVSSARTERAESKLIETRSIDYIPESERHGNVFSQFTLWFGGNLQITAIVTGALTVVLGGDVVWSLIGLLVGQILGAGIMALHAVQGPRLGLPQMITCRTQFGVYGAVIPLVLVCVMYIGFSASGTVLAGQALAHLANISDRAGIIGFGLIIIVVATLGYRLIHGLGKVASVVGVLTFVYLFFRLLLENDIGALLSNNHFSLANFLLAMSLSSSWQIAFCPYVSDYSRYLPRNVSAGKTFFAVFAGTALGTQLSMTLGVIAAALAGKAFSGNEVGYIVGLGSSGTLALVLYFSICFGKITFTTLNAYGSFMSLTTIVCGFRQTATISKAGRITFIVCMVLISCAIAMLSAPSFLKSFTQFLLFLLAFFVPWSAMNLMDYYFITRGHIDIPALSDPDGRYKRWNLVGIATYVAGVLIQLPFISNGFYSGSLVYLFEGNDISWIIGWVFTALCWLLVNQRNKAARLQATVLPQG